MKCPSCGSEAPDKASACPTCGALLPSRPVDAFEAAELDRTPLRPEGQLGDEARAAAARKPASVATTEIGGGPPEIGGGPPEIQEGRFLPGAQLTDRYRIVELVGRGGMGEVYRAHDLKLGQPVALKLLPADVRDDPDRLARFFNEVRTARQVTHPNVCRVHDVGEAGGLHFLSMEYVDGEDLASLLRRIGRLPKDKAIEIARQLCAGLAAVHEQGLLHRDLKPANVMIDGRGHARITDFGLASLATGIRDSEVSAGTPAYMAPEQLAGEEVTTRSEIYALGLVLYELFTGRAPFPATSWAELMERHENATPDSPASLVEGLDPAVDRVILRCLERDPSRRPSSVHEVAAALPGGDPLAAVIAAGEIPSPELVAAAGETSGLRPRVALACLLGLVLALALALLAAPHTQLTGMVPLDKPPAVLIEKARAIIRTAGYPEEPRDHAYEFLADRQYLAHIAANDRSPRRWDRLATERPHPVIFWYRQSPQYLVRYDRPGFGVSYSDSPVVSGMVGVRLDAQGRLRRFETVPPELDAEVGPWPAFDWSPLFAAADLDLADFEPIEPTWTPPVYADRRTAWRGAYPGSRGTPIEVQAAAYRGRPVAFRIVAPWTTPTRQQRSGTGSGITLFALWVFGLLLGAGLLARRNLRLGRSDVLAATRLAFFLLSIRTLTWLLGTHHVPEPNSELWIFIARLGYGLFAAGFVWVFYIALEPYLRRLWPSIMVSWIRLLSGGFRDPLVGRDILAACCFGSAFVLLGRLMQVVPAWLVHPWNRPDVAAETFFRNFELFALGGLRQLLLGILEFQAGILLYVFGGIFGLLLFRLLLRRTWLAIAAYLVVSVVFLNPPTDDPYLLSAFGLAVGLWIAFLFRFGFLAWVVAFFVNALLRGLPLTLDPSAFYFWGSILSLGIVLGLGVYGFYVSLGGQPLFRDEIFAAER